MATAYSQTDISVSRSMTIIRDFLYDRKCEGTRFTDQSEGFIIEFLRPIESPEGVRRILVSLPVRYDMSKKLTAVQWEQHKRTMWRSTYHYLKAMFDGIEKGIIPFEEAFMANVVIKLPNGSQGRVKTHLLPQMMAQKNATLSLDD